MYCELPDFGRCCLCMPLRRGILTFGYINVLFAAFMVGMYSYAVHHDYGFFLFFHGTVSDLGDETCLVLYLVDFVLGSVLLYGAHTRHTLCLKVYYYYGLSTMLATFILQIVSLVNTRYLSSWIIEAGSLFFTGLILHFYLLLLVRSLIKKLSISGQAYENQLQQFVSGEIKLDNGVYPSTVVPIESVHT